MESFVAIMALVAACVLEPGVYFAMNSAPALIGSTPEAAANVISGWGFAITPQGLADIAPQVGEKSILSRTGGAPTLAVGMAKILSSAIGGSGATSFWYHFAILFEALFILTTIDAGTRVARFMIQDLVGNFVPSFNRSGAWIPNLTATALAVTGWGWFLYQGVVDPLGGINTLWPLFGIANQMLAAIALTLCTVVLFRMKRESYAFVALVPDGVALHLHADGGRRENLPPGPTHRLPRPCRRAMARRWRTTNCWRRPRACWRCGASSSTITSTLRWRRC